MPRKPHAAGCVVNSLSTNLTTQYRGLWITDALLTETLHKFCHSPRRYGSNVPGPLEARRRASKRKNTNLAYTGGDQHVYDPAVMLGSGSRDQWWKKVETSSTELNGRSSNPQLDQVGEIEAPSLLPKWLFKPAPSPKAPRLSDNDALSKRGQSRLKTPADILKIEAEFSERIDAAMDLASIQAVTKEMGLNTIQHPNLSEIAFRQLIKVCDNDVSLSDLTNTLYNPEANPPGSGNHLIYIRHLCAHPIDPKMWVDCVFPSLLKGIELGLVRTQDLQGIILLLQDVHKGLDNGQDGDKLHTDWHGIISAIERSRVLRLNDLDPAFLSLWYQKVSQSVLTDDSSLLSWRLRAFSGESDLELASELVRKRLQRIAKSNKSAWEKTNEWIVSLPVNLRGPVIVQSTFKMIAACQQDGDGARIVLERWSRMLGQLRAHGMKDFTINKSVWAQAAATDSCKLASSQQLLTAIWILTRIFGHQPDAMVGFANRSFRDEFDKTFGKGENLDQFDYVSQVVLTLDTLPLPKKDRVFEFLHNFSEVNLMKALGGKDHLEALRDCFRLDYVQLRDNKFIRKTRRNFPDVFQALSESINTDIGQFKAMAQTLILKSHENFRIVSRLLDFNMELKFAAARSWPSSMENVEVEILQQQGFDPTSILAMLESLAMTFAVTPIVTPRSSFRHVYKMYLFLHKIGAPINPVIGRALWHAGVTRYGQAGAPRAQVLWCLSKVREQEGHAIANQLLWSSGFRSAFVHDFIRTLKDNRFLPQTPSSLEGVSANDR